MKQVKIFLVLICIASQAQSQVSEVGMPYTFSILIADTVPTVRMDSVDVHSLLAEDEREVQQGIPVPFRFGYPFEVSLGPNSILRT